MANGRAFFRCHHTWSVIERKYLEMIAQLKQEETALRRHRVEPIPSWLARRFPPVAPSLEVVDRLPAGPALTQRRPGAQRPNADS